MIIKTKPSPFSKWEKGSGSFINRLKEGIILPDWQPRFIMPKDSSIFTIGSCFARNIEIDLHQMGFDVTSIDRNHPQPEISSNVTLGLLNKYNPVSILQELEWSLKLRNFPEHGLIQYHDKVIDPYLHEEAPPTSKKEALERRASIAGYFKKAFDADLVIITLGLIETWFDPLTKLALNGALSKRVSPEIRSMGFKQLQHHECKTVMHSICHLLQKYGNKDKKIITTLSPVAMKRTFSKNDILIANCQSKSTLRSVIGEIITERQDIDYFPAFEAVTLSDPACAYKKNQREVSEQMVQHVMHLFKQKAFTPLN